MKKLSNALYNNAFVTHFEGDESGSKQPRQTPGVFYSKAIPTPVKQPVLLAWSDELAADLELEKPAAQQDIDILGGNFLAPGMYPYAACYAGHQFGNWAGQLGDGRAITLGELQTSKGAVWELQLKGAGPTAYSRRADGRAVLRSSVREYLMSEAMHYLGVPTTRALSLVSTGEKVMRDMFYDGNAAYEPGAIVLRVAPTFLRFGNFEILAARGEVAHLKKLVSWTLEKHYPHITGNNSVLQWFREVVQRTATLMVEWLRVGFVHGVMNTDNMSILGVTIDYGPYSFVDDYDPAFTPNTTDLPGRRYAFGKQPAVAKWNLGCLAGALAPLFETTDELVAVLDEYDTFYWQAYYTMMGNKLGLDAVSTEADVAFIRQVETMLATLKPDMTIFYQQLIQLPDTTDEDKIVRHFNDSFYNDLTGAEQTLFVKTITDYQQRIAKNNLSAEDRVQRMQAANPRFILRNYLLHQAIENLEGGDDALFKKLQQAMKTPYAPDNNAFFEKRPGWATQKAGRSMLSCSS